ncbi:transcription termination factor 2 isoform X2 [Malaya genurostris]|uniref:transcription termination factor 2 isoform X2 n=1 Tax=Malaya genurostris TaxID=325434 RepID=UPI0026F3B00D|nr:transcription termination factor 2 isoform X2 [Malaya genurostris]
MVNSESFKSEDEFEEDSEYDEIRERIKKRQSQRMSLHPRYSNSSDGTDNEDEKQKLVAEGEILISCENEPEVENRALSPATRLSITGIRPDDLSSDEEEFIFTKKTRKVLISDDESGFEPNLEVDEKHESSDDSLPMCSFDTESSKRDSISTKLSSTVVSEEINNESVDSSADKRLSTHVRQSIGTKLSSTAIDEKDEQSKQDERNSSSNSTTQSLEVLTLSSDDDDGVPQRKTLIQPTITNAFGKRLVSQNFYDGKMRKLSELKSSLVSMEKLTRVAPDLPDKGVALLKRMVVVKKEIQDLSKDIKNMEIQDSKNVKNEIRKSFENSIDSSGRIIIESRNTSIASNESSIQTSREQSKSQTNVSWEDIENAAKQIQPKHTGKQGLATFESKKTLTMDRLATLHKSIETCPSEDTFAEPPKLLKIELMNHQLHALAWMQWRENQKPRGGILADDMGLGKTLSMISLILKTIEMSNPDEEIQGDSSEEEIDAHIGWLARGRQDYYAGGTLIICPASLMKQWEGEITNRVTRNSLAVIVHHGTNRDVKPRHLAKYDVVITTYNIVSRELKAERNGLFGVNWERIILDEAHVIRNHKSAMSVACCELKGRFRWALTGTPIQNKEMDMYALMKFLRCSPFDDLAHWKQWIDNKSAGGMVRLNTIMKSIMLRRTKQQLKEKGSLQGLPEKFIQLIEVNLYKEEMNVYQKVLLYSRTLFDQFLRQRAHKENANYFGGHQPTFVRTNEPNYDRVHQKLKELHTKDEVKQYQILVLLLRLRQICCHPGLIHRMLEDDDGNFDVSTVEEEQDLDLLEQLNKLKLTDKSTSGDANASIEGGNKKLNISDTPPEVAEAITKASSKVMLRSNPVFNLERASSKIAKVLEVIEEKILQSDDKAVIVSQWSSMLDIVAQHLSWKRVRYVSLTGKVQAKYRNDIVVDFNKQSSGAKVMLLSLTAGGVGLNLVGANHLFLLDLHWNPQLESQAQDRVYRVGQKKKVYIWKFMCKDTVEQAIRVLQEKKLGIANDVLTGTKQTGSKLSIDDLKTLFGL